MPLAQTIIDITHTVRPGMPVYPGDESPALYASATLVQDGYAVTRLTMPSHCGTHVDAPAHLMAGGRRLADYPVSHFMGLALVVDCRAAAFSEDRRITMEMLGPALPHAKEAEFLLFSTGWSQFWGSPRYFEDFPVMDDEVLALAASGEFKGVGFDTPSPDRVGDETEKAHRQLFAAERTLIFENLKDLVQLEPGLWNFAGLPLRWEGADGSPVRAVAWR